LVQYGPRRTRRSTYCGYTNKSQFPFAHSKSLDRSYQAPVTTNIEECKHEDIFPKQRRLVAAGIDPWSQLPFTDAVSTFGHTADSQRFCISLEQSHTLQSYRKCKQSRQVTDVVGSCFQTLFILLYPLRQRHDDELASFRASVS